MNTDLLLYWLNELKNIFQRESNDYKFKLKGLLLNK